MNYFDCHADTVTEIKSSESLGVNSGNLDLKRVRGFAEKYTQIFAIWKDAAAGDAARPGKEFIEAYERAKSLFEAEKDSLTWCRTGAEMQAAHAEGKAAAFLAVEDLSAMGDYTEQIKSLGIRFAMLTWNYENRYACGAATDQRKGLKPDGKVAARELAEQGIILDISHLSDRGADELFELTDAPLIASHSNMRTVWNQPRNLTKELARELIRRKGLIGMNFYRNFVKDDADVTDILRHMDAVLEMGGEDVLAIGSDFDGSNNCFPAGICGVESIPALRERMEKEGFGAALSDKIFFGNAEAFVIKNVE